MAYGVEHTCDYCGNKFITKPRYVKYCSTPCKNPINRKGHIAWNKGIKLTEEQKAKQNREGLAKGWGWNKGLPNEKQREKWLTNNPNKDGKVNNTRPKKQHTDKLKIYRGQVRYFTYRTIKEMKQNGEYVPKTGKYPEDFQLDHIISIMQGFNLGILPQVLGSKNNLQFIKGKENRNKWHTDQPVEVLKEIIGDIDGLFSTGN